MRCLTLLFLAPGCIIESTTASTTVTAHWTIGDASGMTTGCKGFDIARLIAQPVLGGDATLTDFDCAAGLGVSAALAPAQYDLAIEIRATDGTVYASSLPKTIDLSNGDDERLDATILDDAGYAHVAWTFAGATTGNTLSCVGVDHVIVTAATGATRFQDVFTCEDHGGLTGALPAGDYTFSVEATALDQPIGMAADLSNQTIEAKNRVTDLGSVQISIAGK